MDTSGRLRSQLRARLRIGFWLDFCAMPRTRWSGWLTCQCASVERTEEGRELAAEVAPGAIRPVQATDIDEPRLEHRPERVIRHICETYGFLGLSAAIADLMEEQSRNISAIAWPGRISTESRLCDSYRAAPQAAEICEIGDSAVPLSDPGRSLPGAPDVVRLTNFQPADTIGQLRSETRLARKTQNA
jgi:hypothetical protein